jgi:ADP-ribosylglycohydrolase
MTPAWRVARDLYERACPVDRRVEPHRWTRTDFQSIDNRRMRIDAWGAAVPGSGAWDSMWPAAIASCSARGLDVRKAEALLGEGLTLRAAGDDDALLELDRRFRDFLDERMTSPPVVIGFGDDVASQDVHIVGEISVDLDEAVHGGWTGQIAGGAFGTPLEGCTGAAIASVYGDIIDDYPAAPDTLNDDVVYELVALTALGQVGRATTAAEIGRQWAARIPFGWSAEWVALDHLRAGLDAPASGTTVNAFSDWIGAQMRGMVFGLLCPARPYTAARWAAIDASVSHDHDGAVGAMWSAALCSLSFTKRRVRDVLFDVLAVLPPSRTRAVLRRSLDVCARSATSTDAWRVLDAELIRFGWVHTFPNAAAVTIALWFAGDDITAGFALLAQCGADVDCNAGLVGTICGIRRSVPDQWARPLHDRFDTYLPGHEEVDITALAVQTRAVSARIID